MISRYERQMTAAARERSREAGFTLIEIIVVLAVVGFALLLIVGYKPPWSSGLGVRGAAAEVASSLRLARSEAILRNRPVAFEIDLASRRFRAGSGAVRQLPSHLSIALLTVQGERRDVSTGDIRFNPDGSSTGGRISLGDGAHKMAVGVEWLSGRVSIADGQ